MQLQFQEICIEHCFNYFLEHTEEVPGVHCQTDHGADQGGMADFGGTHAAPPQGSA